MNEHKNYKVVEKRDGKISHIFISNKSKQLAIAIANEMNKAANLSNMLSEKCGFTYSVEQIH